MGGPVFAVDSGSVALYGGKGSFRSPGRGQTLPTAGKLTKRRRETCESPLAALPLTDLHAYTVLRRQSRQELVVKVPDLSFLGGQLESFRSPQLR